MLPVSGRFAIPPEVREIARRGLFKRAEWRKVFRVVEVGAMGAGGILQENLEQMAPLAPSTLARKKREGLPSTPLVGRRGRILKALTNPSSGFRNRFVSKRGGLFLLYFRGSRFPQAGADRSITDVLQRGRVASSRTHSGKTLSRGETISVIRANKARLKIAGVERTPGRPVLSYYPGNEAKLTPALIKGVYQVLKEKRLTT